MIGEISLDLLHLFKETPQEDRLYVLIQITNGNYYFNGKYRNLNNFNQEIINVAVEKLMDRVVGSEVTLFIEQLNEFSRKVDYYDEKKLNENLFKNLKYELLVNSSNKVKKIIIKYTSLLVALSIMFTMMQRHEKIDDQTVQNENEPEVIQTEPEEIVEDTIIEYTNEEITEEDKLEFIYEQYNIDYEKLNVICAIVIAEAKANSYDDAYAVINTLDNRTKSIKWINEANNYFKTNVGDNIYYQAILTGQFVVFENNAYLEYLGNTDLPGYKAAIDYLYTCNPIHNYLSFRAGVDENIEYEEFDVDGNKYFDLETADDRVQTISRTIR